MNGGEQFAFLFLRRSIFIRWWSVARAKFVYRLSAVIGGNPKGSNQSYANRDRSIVSVDPGLRNSVSHPPENFDSVTKHPPLKVDRL